MYLFPGEIPRLRRDVAEKDSHIALLEQELGNASVAIETLRRDNKTAWQTVSDKDEEIGSLRASLAKAQLALVEVNASVETKTTGTFANGITFTDTNGQDYRIPVSHGRCKIILPNYRTYTITIHYIGIGLIPGDCAASPHTWVLNATAKKIEPKFHD